MSPDARWSAAADSISARVRRKAPYFDVEEMDPRTTIVVMGFPRSGNTYLHAWLSSMVAEGIAVFDGRTTHSALDLLRLARAGIPVLVPVREPLGACASMMVRTGSFQRREHAEDILKAYGAWYGVARAAAPAPTVGTVMFEELTADPVSAVSGTPAERMLDDEALLQFEAQWFVDRLRSDLAEVPGQGLPQDGVPAHQMISLPHPGRAVALDRARALLSDPSVRGHLARAHDAYRAYLEASGADGSEPARQLPQHADGEASRHGRDEGARVRK